MIEDPIPSYRFLVTLVVLFLVSLLPVINLRLSLYQTLGERFLYLPTVFACILVAYRCSLLMRKRRVGVDDVPGTAVLVRVLGHDDGGQRTHRRACGPRAFTVHWRGAAQRTADRLVIQRETRQRRLNEVSHRASHVGFFHEILSLALSPGVPSESDLQVLFPKRA